MNGTISEVIWLYDTDTVWVEVSGKQVGGINLVLSAQALGIRVGDEIRWAGDYAYWTNRDTNVEVRLHRIGPFGAVRPNLPLYTHYAVGTLTNDPAVVVRGRRLSEADCAESQQVHKTMMKREEKAIRIARALFPGAKYIGGAFGYNFQTAGGVRFSVRRCYIGDSERIKWSVFYKDSVVDVSMFHFITRKRMQYVLATYGDM